jgi:hypothetical protein
VILLAAGVSLLLLSRQMHRAGPGGKGWTRVSAEVTGLLPVVPERTADNPWPRVQSWEVSFSLAQEEGLPVSVTWRSPERSSSPRQVLLADVDPFEKGRSVRLWIDPTRTRVEPVDSLPSHLLALGSLLLLVSVWAFIPRTTAWFPFPIRRRQTLSHWTNSRQAYLTGFLAPLLVLAVIGHEAVFSVLTKRWLWPEVPARVITNQLEKRGGGRGGCHTDHMLRFTYEWKGVPYQSTQFGALPALTFPPFQADWRQASAAEATTCRVNPWNPTRAELQSGPGGSGLIMLAIVFFWLQVSRQVYILSELGPRKFALALRARRRQSLAGLPLRRRVWMRFIWWLDPFWEFGQNPPSTPEKDSVARWTQPGS